MGKRSNETTVALKKVCVILGAGASYDVSGEGSPIINDDFRPPLAIDLFNISKHESYYYIMQRYNGAVFLGQELARKSSSGAINIERELRRYSSHEDKVTREHFKHIPAYLRDLLYRVSTEYTYVPSSYIELVQKLLADYPHDVLFIILNYDNLLESALERYNAIKFKFSDINQYVSDSRNAKVVKIHGSINWFRYLPGSGNEQWDSAVSKFDIFEPLPEHEIIIKNGVPVVKEFVYDGYRIYPVLTAPLAGKGINSAVCPQNHIIEAKKFIKGCAKFLIIGTSGLDEDLLEILDKSIDPMQGVLVDIVNKGREADNAQNRFVRGIKAFQNIYGSNLMTLYTKGFRKYLTSLEFNNFIKFRM